MRESSVVAMAARQSMTSNQDVQRRGDRSRWTSDRERPSDQAMIEATIAAKVGKNVATSAVAEAAMFETMNLTTEPEE